MERRQFLGILGSLAAGWPCVSMAQQPGRVRRIAILHDYIETDPEGRVQIAALRDELAKLGWVEGRNLVIDLRSGAEEADALRGPARDLLAKSPDVVLGAGGTIVAALQKVSKTVPVVFVNVTDPVGGGLVSSLAHPGGNTTGFTQFEFGISAKWIEILKEVAPGTTRVAVIRDPTARSGGGQLGAIQAVAPRLGIDIKPIDAEDIQEIEHDLKDFSRQSGGGLIVTSSRLARIHREKIIALARLYRLPAIYAFRVYVSDGGLISYGPDSVSPYRRAAAYIDRILKGEKPADLPVQAPLKYELTINLKAANALGLSITPSLLTSADEVIE
jgi:putative ABC transport system substrate-binding protein